MPDSPPLTIVNVGYPSTNSRVISAGRQRMLEDCGCPAHGPTRLFDPGI